MSTTIPARPLTIWFLTGSQELYGEETLRQVACAQTLPGEIAETGDEEGGDRQQPAGFRELHRIGLPRTGRRADRIRGAAAPRRVVRVACAGRLRPSRPRGCRVQRARPVGIDRGQHARLAARLAWRWPAMADVAGQPILRSVPPPAMIEAQDCR